MPHTPAPELAERLKNARELVEVGARYAHYKHPDKPYRVLTIALTEETEEPAVIYEQEHDEGLTFIRPLTSFTETLDIDGVSTPRFTKLS